MWVKISIPRDIDRIEKDYEFQIRAIKILENGIYFGITSNFLSYWNSMESIILSCVRERVHVHKTPFT